MDESNALRTLGTEESTWLQMSLTVALEVYNGMNLSTQ